MDDPDGRYYVCDTISITRLGGSYITNITFCVAEEGGKIGEKVSPGAFEALLLSLFPCLSCPTFNLHPYPEDKNNKIKFLISFEFFFGDISVVFLN